MAFQVISIHSLRFLTVFLSLWCQFLSNSCLLIFPSAPSIPLSFHNYHVQHLLWQALFFHCHYWLLTYPLQPSCLHIIITAQYGCYLCITLYFISSIYPPYRKFSWSFFSKILSFWQGTRGFWPVDDNWPDETIVQL